MAVMREHSLMWISSKNSLISGSVSSICFWMNQLTNLRISIHSSIRLKSFFLPLPPPVSLSYIDHIKKTLYIYTHNKSARPLIS